MEFVDIDLREEAVIDMAVNELLDSGRPVGENTFDWLHFGIIEKGMPPASLFIYSASMSLK